MSKSLLDIQQEIRSLNRTVKELSESISEIYREIEKLRNDDVFHNDYDTIRLLSSHFCFGQHPLSRLKDSIACKYYIHTLLGLVQVDDGADSTIYRLVFIQWLLSQSQQESNLEELQISSLTFNTSTFNELVECIPKSYRKHLIMDALIIANICGPAKDNCLIYIIDLCGILGIKKDELRILSIMANAILKQDLEKIKSADLEAILIMKSPFRHYLSKEIIDAGIRNQRTLAVEFQDKTYSHFKWKVKQQAKVREGDVIASYYSKPAIHFMTNIIAPCEGTLFQFRKNGINYGVIAHESDSKDSIKAWIIQRR